MQIDGYDFSTCFLSLSLHASVRARVHASDVNYPCAWSQVMLTDFGLAKQFDENTRSNSTCGTLEYMSSETVLAKGHDKATDWWSVGSCFTKCSLERLVCICWRAPQCY